MFKRELNNHLSFIKMPSLELLTEQEQRETKGGDHTLAQLLTIFSNTTSNGLNALPPTQYAYFTQMISEINSTSIGHDMLESLYTATSANPISLNFGPSISGAYYEDSSHSLNFGTVGDLLAKVYNVTNTADTEGMNFMIIAHEVFHAYEHLVANSGTAGSTYFQTIRPEVDSTLFAAMTLKEYDLQGNGHNLLNQVKDARYYTPQINSNLNTQNYNANSAFSAAWGHLIDDGHFTVSDYNTLVANFATGANYKGSTGTVQSLTTTDAVTNFFIKEYYPQYSPSTDPSNQSTGNGSTGVGNFGGIWDSATGILTLNAPDPSFINNWQAGLYNSLFGNGGGPSGYSGTLVGEDGGHWEVGGGGLVLYWKKDVSQSM